MPQQVLIVGDDGKSRKAEAQRPMRGLGTIAVTAGLVYAAASFLDLVLGLALVDWGNPVARFTAVTSAGAALPMLAVGVVTLTVVAILSGSRQGAMSMMAVVDRLDRLCGSVVSPSRRIAQGRDLVGRAIGQRGEEAQFVKSLALHCATKARAHHAALFSRRILVLSIRESSSSADIVN